MVPVARGLQNAPGANCATVTNTKTPRRSIVGGNVGCTDDDYDDFSVILNGIYRVIRPALRFRAVKIHKCKRLSNFPHRPVRAVCSVCCEGRAGSHCRTLGRSRCSRWPFVALSCIANM